MNKIGDRLRYERRDTASCAPAPVRPQLRDLHVFEGNRSAEPFNRHAFVPCEALKARAT
jgi:hypothetical protein